MVAWAATGGSGRGRAMSMAERELPELVAAMLEGREDGIDHG